MLISHNPWNGNGFKLQIVAIVLGPTLICIGLYLTLKHAVTALNPSLSRVAPRWYPWFFVPADVSCLVIQAIGGGIAAAAGRDKFSLLQHGNRMIIAGICLQVVVLGVFGGLGIEYLLRVKRWVAEEEAKGVESVAAVERQDKRGVALWRDSRFRTFLYAMAGAYSTLMIRCVYRIAEMAGGWGNHIMQDEPSFVVLESFMVLIASLFLAGFAPGVFFPAMVNSGESRVKTGKTDGETSGNDTAETRDGAAAEKGVSTE